MDFPKNIDPRRNNRPDRDKDLNYWLKKLYIQEEELRKLEREKEIKIENDIVEDDLAQLGKDRQTTNLAAKKQRDDQTVSDLVKKSNRRIITISSEFPWDLFPNKIIVEESRVTFEFNQLFFSQSHSVDIKDISNVFIESAFFFSTLQIVSRTFVKNDIKVHKLNKAKAIVVQRIIEGLRTFSEHNINTSEYEIDDLISKIGEFHSRYQT